MNLATASKRHVEGEEETQEVVQEDGTKVIVKKAPRQRQAESKDNQMIDDFGGFEKASDKRRIQGRDNRGYGQDEDEDEGLEPTDSGWGKK